MEAGQRRSALPGRDAEANVRSLHYALKALSDDHGGTFIWEFFAGHARPTLLSLHGGHVAGAPVDLLGGYDLRDRHTRQHMLEQVRRHRLWLVTVAWPCRLWGSLARWNRGMGRIPDLQEQRDADEADFLRFVEELALERKAGGRLLLGENPLNSDAQETKPLRRLQDKHGYMCVRGDQCQHDLMDISGEGYHLKPTGLLVPEGSALAWTTSRRCEGVNEERQHTWIEGKEAATQAAAWQWELSKSIMLGAIWDRAKLVAPKLRRILQRYCARSPSRTAQMGSDDVIAVAELLLMRSSSRRAYDARDEHRRQRRPGVRLQYHGVIAPAPRCAAALPAKPFAPAPRGAAAISAGS